MKLIDTNAVIDVPPEVRLCPYCGEKLYVQFSCWSQCEDGTWAADGVDLECTTEPELDEFSEDDTAAWDNWFATHSEMPYMYWLPATVAVEKWVNEHYRFALMEKL